MEEIKNTLKILAKQIAEQIIAGNIIEVEKHTYETGTCYSAKVIIIDNLIFPFEGYFSFAVSNEPQRLFVSHEPLLPHNFFDEWKDEIIDAVINKYNIINNNNLLN